MRRTERERNEAVGHRSSLICKGSHSGPFLREQGVGSSNLPAPTNKINYLAFSAFASAPDIAPETK